MNRTNSTIIPRKAKSAIILIVLSSVIFCSCVSVNQSIIATNVTPQLSGLADKVEVVYFHRHRRCEACIYAEERINYLVKNNFQTELSSGKMTFGIYDIEDKNYSDLARKYGAIGSQLFVNRIKGGIDNIRYIEEIWYWGCIDNETVFDKTVINVITGGLYGK